LTTTPFSDVRVRFAPSPTGPMHIGGARTALFNWLFARHNGGKFILRIEDTDQKRFDPNALDQITGALRWLGLDWDEGPEVGGPYGPYVQSERLDLYHQWANWLLEHDKAYKCFCTPERLEQVNKEKEARKEPPGYDRYCRNLSRDEVAQNEAEGKSYIVRFKMPLEGETTVYDLIRGDVTFDNSTLQDLVLLKSDGYPTYHLANVVDDHLMHITHILRANEWLSSAPLHYQLYQAFGWPMPAIAHLPVLLNPNGKGKLSKRSTGFTEGGQKVLVLVKEFQEAGYLPEAVVNFLTNVGWSFGDEREVFTVEEAVERFDITKVQAANSAFPMEKLDWLNGLYIREKLSPEELANRLKPVLERHGLKVDDDLLRRVVPLVQIRLKSPEDIVELAGFFFRDDFTPAPPQELIQKKMDAAQTKAALERAYEKLAAMDEFEHDRMDAELRPLAEELGLSAGQLFGALRVAITAQAVATPLFETMMILGKETTLQRIQQAIDSLSILVNEA